MNNTLLYYALSIIPGLGHIALGQRLKGYGFLSLFLAVLGIIYYTPIAHPDPSIMVRLWVTVLLLLAPLYAWVVSNLGSFLSFHESTFAFRPSEQ